MADDFLDHEGEEFFREIGVEIGRFGQGAKPLDLFHLALGIGAGQVQFGLQLADALSTFEPFGQHMDQGRINIVDAVAQR